MSSEVKKQNFYGFGYFRGNGITGYVICKKVLCIILIKKRIKAYKERLEYFITSFFHVWLGF